MYEAAECGPERQPGNQLNSLAQDLWSTERIQYQSVRSSRALTLAEEAFFETNEFPCSTDDLYKSENKMLAQGPKSGEQAAFINEHPLTKNELAHLTDISTSPKFLEAGRHEINKYGTEPADTLPTLLEENRILAISEFHRSPNAMRTLATGIISNLKKAGATHLALEMEESLQINLDIFMKTGQLDPKSLPVGLRDDDYIKMLEAARKHGLKLVAVDANSQMERDENMAKRLEGILTESPTNKIIFWAGAGHIQCTDDNAMSAIEYLKHSRNKQITTVFSELPDLPNRLNRLVPDLSRAVCLPTQQSTNLSEIHTFGLLFKDKYHDFDHVIIFPSKDSGT